MFLKLHITLLFVALFSGCATVYDEIDSTTMTARDRVWAEVAWHRYKSYYEEVPYKHDFEKGFKQGYIDIAQGGSGCPPTLPPRCYWKVCYQNEAGKTQVAVWYDGYSHGVLVAEQEGVSGLNKIPVNASEPLYPDHPFYRRYDSLNFQPIPDPGVEIPLADPLAVPGAGGIDAPPPQGAGTNGKAGSPPTAPYEPDESPKDETESKDEATASPAEAQALRTLQISPQEFFPTQNAEQIERKFNHGISNADDPLIFPGPSVQ